MYNRCNGFDWEQPDRSLPPARKYRAKHGLLPQRLGHTNPLRINELLCHNVVVDPAARAGPVANCLSLHSMKPPSHIPPRPQAQAPFAYRAATALVSAVPRSWLWILGRAAGLIHCASAGEKRRNYMSNLSQLTNKKHDIRPWRAFQNHSMNLLELLGAARQSDEQILSRIHLRGAGHIDEALRAGRGLILATIHTGNWELAGLLLAKSGYPVTTVAGVQLREGWSDQIKAFKERFGISIVSAQASMRQLYRDLRSNRVVVLHVDGDVFRGGVRANLLGKTIVVPRGPARLSRVLQAPSAFAYCWRSGDDQLTVTIERSNPPPSDEDGENQLTQSYVRRLEKCILEDPAQWCIFRKL